ncbi:HAMP domain-containing histidine kinase [Jiangella aurantiaca]|uniref:histidine kinase n=1 Tax=Jiangella aurantiaca TaxID=2530373 RepID=A0A4R5AAH0_9ACTN|nr:HAMP domain-containing sensor histidine kinase [Jiangella aurantiaca]TDD69141.1 HAMP domain-containing histidine kinase [Jiangella aurantiaca]
MRHPLRRRLVWTVVALVLTVTATLAVVSTLVLRSTLYDQLDTQLLAAADRAKDAAGPGGGHGTGEPPDEPRVPPGQATGTVEVYYEDGRVEQAGYLDDSGVFQPLDDAQLAALEELPCDGVIRSVELPGLGTFHAVGTMTGGDPVVTAMSTADAAGTIGSYVGLEIGLAAAGVAVAAGAGTVLVRRALRPLDEVAAVAGQVTELPLDRGEVDAIPRVPPALAADWTEVGRVGAAFNRMVGHVESALSVRHESEQQVRRFVADASHELRTPLASIRGYAELVRRSPDAVPPSATQAIGRVEAEADRMTGLVDDLLLLARLDAGRPLDRTPVDLAALLVDAVADAHAAGPDHAWRLDLGSPPAPLLVEGDEARLRQVLANLLGNARVHTPPGTTVWTSGRVAGDEVVLEVRDDGPGVPVELRRVLFQRFSRADTARSRGGGSTGLGLAIAEAIVQAHRGSVTVASRTAAEGTAGTTFTVRLPALTADAQLVHGSGPAAAVTVEP